MSTSVGDGKSVTYSDTFKVMSHSVSWAWSAKHCCTNALWFWTGLFVLSVKHLLALTPFGSVKHNSYAAMTCRH